MRILAVVPCSVASVWIGFLFQYWTACTTFRSKRFFQFLIIVSSLFDWKIAEVLLSRWGFLIFLDSGILKKKVYPPPPLVFQSWILDMFVFHNQSFKNKIENVNISLTTGEQTGKRTSLNIWSDKMNAIISLLIYIHSH